MPLFQLKEEDLRLVLSWRNSESIRTNMFSNHIITYDEHLAWFHKIDKEKTSFWYIFVDSFNNKRGLVYFTKYDEYSRNSFLGLYSSPDSPPGVGAKIEFEALEHAFEILNMHKLNCDVLCKNKDAIQMHLKFGFKNESIFKDSHFDGKLYNDVVRLGITHDEWKDKSSYFGKYINRIKAY